VEIQERFDARNITPSNFKHLFSLEQQALIAAHYNELTPPSQIPYEVRKLVDFTNSENFRKMHPVQRAAILGLRLVCIHPFDNANGSMLFFSSFQHILKQYLTLGTQQLLMSLELMRAGYPPFVRREMSSYSKYLRHDIHSRDPNCEVFYHHLSSFLIQRLLRCLRAGVQSM
jgi:hypothetical protein